MRSNGFGLLCQFSLVYVSIQSCFIKNISYDFFFLNTRKCLLCQLIDDIKILRRASLLIVLYNLKPTLSPSFVYTKNILSIT